MPICFCPHCDRQFDPEKTPNSLVSKMIKHPVTGKRLRDVTVRGKGPFTWNSAYRLYNSRRDYGHLRQADLKNLVFE